jgi:cytochrome c oxidase assembly factor CtaG
MVDLRLLAAYFEPGGPYEKYGELMRRARMSKPGRYTLAIAACIGLFVLLTPMAMLLAHFTSHQTAASLFTPLFWISAILIWRAIVRDDDR